MSKDAIKFYGCQEIAKTSDSNETPKIAILNTLLLVMRNNGHNGYKKFYLQNNICLKDLI